MATIVGTAGNDTLQGTGDADDIRGGDGNDLIFGHGGDDQLYGEGGNDQLDGGAGADAMAGGAGNDVYFVDILGDTLTENPAEGFDEVRTALASYSLLAQPNLENLTGTSSTGQTLTGNAKANLINGGPGSDMLHLSAGGDDRVFGGAGNDIFFFLGALTAWDMVDGGPGIDTLVLQGNYADRFVFNATVTRIEGISILGGNNISFGEPGTNRYDYNIVSNDQNFAAGVQARINGSALQAGEDLTFDGSFETDARFVIYGGKGADALKGGRGDDIFFFGEQRLNLGDEINGGPGYDGLFLRGNYRIRFDEPAFAGAFVSIENITLTSAADERYARGGTEFDYALTLANGLVGAGQTLTVSGALLTAAETMEVDGSQETDGMLRLFGGASDDTLRGGGQADLIYGNLGADALAGNGGADRFRYQNVRESNSAAMDRILDFTPGTDKVELDRIDANTLVAGNQAFSWIGSSAFSGSAGQLRAYQSGGTWFVEGDVNGDSVADLVIALTLQGPTPLGAGDFLL